MSFLPVTLDDGFSCRNVNDVASWQIERARLSSLSRSRAECRRGIGALIIQRLFRLDQTVATLMRNARSTQH